jgi:hypothetical protein
MVQHTGLPLFTFKLLVQIGKYSEHFISKANEDWLSSDFVKYIDKFQKN